MLRDYRQMLHAHSMDEIKARVARNGPLNVTGRKLKAYVNHGRWVADCACGGGVACGPDSPDAVCYDCRSVWLITFPTVDRITNATALLAQRTAARQRHWRPDQGETITDLRAQNAAAEILSVAPKL